MTPPMYCCTMNTTVYNVYILVRKTLSAQLYFFNNDTRYISSEVICGTEIYSLHMIFRCAFCAK